MTTATVTMSQVLLAMAARIISRIGAVIRRCDLRSDQREKKRGRAENAEQLLRDAAAAGDPCARAELVTLLENRGRGEDAKQLLRDAAAAGDRYARAELARLLHKLGRGEEGTRLEIGQLEPDYFRRP